MARRGRRRRWNGYGYNPPAESVPSVPTMPTRPVERTVRFETFQTYVDAVETSVPTTIGESHNTSGDPIWYGTPDFPTAIALARNGWAEGIASARVLRDAHVSKLAETLKRTEWLHSVEGGRGDVDMAVFQTGNPECILAPTDVEDTQPRHAVHVVFNATVSAAVSPETIIARGSAVAALVDLLDMAGYITRVTLAYATNQAPVEFYIDVKSQGEPLDLARLTLALAHPSSLRRLQFAMYESYGIGGSYGRPIDCTERGDVYLPCILTGNTTDWDGDRAHRWVLKQLRDQGVEVNSN